MEDPNFTVPLVMESVIKAVKDSGAKDPLMTDLLLNCPKCFFCSYSSTAMEKHIDEIHAPNKGCGTGMDTKRAKHPKIESGEYREVVHGPKQDNMTIHQCPACDKKFIRKQLMKIHMRKAHVEVMMNQTNDRIGTKKASIISKETPEEYRDLAIKIAREPEAINVLFQQNLNPEGKKFVCLLCYNQFNNKSHAKDHIRSVHLKLQLFQCEVCEQKFRYKGALNTHRAKIHQIPKASEADKKPIVDVIVTDFDAGSVNNNNNNSMNTPSNPGKSCSRIASPSISKSLKRSPRKPQTAANSPIHVGDKDKFEFKIGCSQCERKFPSPLKLKRHVHMAHYGSSRGT